MKENLIVNNIWSLVVEFMISFIIGDTWKILGHESLRAKSFPGKESSLTH